MNSKLVTRHSELFYIAAIAIPSLLAGICLTKWLPGPWLNALGIALIAIIFFSVLTAIWIDLARIKSPGAR